jgi:hypothetical protein
MSKVRDNAMSFVEDEQLTFEEKQGAWTVVYAVYAALGLDAERSPDRLRDAAAIFVGEIRKLRSERDRAHRAAEAAAAEVDDVISFDMAAVATEAATEAAGIVAAVRDEFKSGGPACRALDRAIKLIVERWGLS